MGIRESLRQQPDELKMQDFVIEDEPKESSPLDFLSADVISDIKKEIDKLRESKSWQNFFRTAYFYSILFPDRKTDLKLENIDISEQTIEAIYTHYSINRNQLFPRIAALCPNVLEKFPQIKELYAIESGKIKNTLLIAKKEKHNPSFTLELGEHLLMCDPEAYLKNPFEPKDWDDFGKNADTVFKEMSSNKSFFDLFDIYVEQIYRMKIFFPQETNQILSKYNFWKKFFTRKIKDTLSHTNQDAKIDLVYYSAIYKILLAENIKITNQGLELEMPDKKSHQQKIPPRPERRT